MIRTTAGATFLGFLLLGNWAWGQPSLSHLSPAAVQPGATVELTLHGDKLEGPLRVWTSFPAKAELAASPADAKDLKSRVCKLTLESDLTVGIGGIAVGSEKGVSEVLLLMIDGMDSVVDNGNNHSLAEAQPITPPIAVEGVVDGSLFDHYKFSGKKNQRVSVEVLAARLATSLDPVVRLLRADGSELSLADDDISLGADCRLTVKLPDEGEYLLEIRDNQYRGGGRYRLRVGDFPLVTVPYPLAGRLGSTRRFDFAGSSGDEVSSLMLRVPDRPPGDRLAIPAQFPDGNASAMATLIASDLPEVVESEPNNAAKLATPATLPAGLNGRLEPAGDQDSFEFAALKDQSFTFQAISRSLGSPSVALMRLYDAAGNQLAESPVNENDEWSLDYKFPEDGMYRLMVEDLVRRGGPEHAYRIEARPSVGFNLAIKQDESTRFHPPVNRGAIALSIQCDRQGYNGPVELALSDEDPGFELMNQVIPSGAKTHELIIVVTEGAKPGDLHPLRIVGKPTDSRVARTVSATNVATLRTQKPQLVFPPPWLNGLLFAAVGPETPPFYAAKLSASAADFDRDKGQAQFTLSLARTNAEFKEALSVLVAKLPNGFSAEVKAEADDYNITITGPKDAPDASHSLQVISYGEFKGQGVVHVHDALLHLKKRGS